MRTLEECQAEVFRRSEQRIKARKKRVIAACVPLAVLLLAAAFFPWEQEIGISDGSMMQEYAKPESAGNDAVSEPVKEDRLESVEIVGGGTVGSEEEIRKILELIGSAISTPEGFDGIADGETNSGTSGEESREEIYQIVVTNADGSTTEYILEGLVLTNQETGACFVLDQESYEALLEALGLKE